MQILARTSGFLALLSCLAALALVQVNAAVVHAADSGDVDFLSDAYYDEEPETISVYDPLEPMNRAIFTFNDRAYFWVLKPVATGYAHVLPWEVRGCVSNFFNNLQEPVRFVNCLLQARFSDAGRVLARFLINSTGGVFGLADPATRDLDIPPVDASLGQTLGRWGIGDGFYLVMPLFGSTTLRDFSGTVVDALAMTPYYSWSDDFVVNAGIYAEKEVNKISLHLGEYEDLKELSFDPYISLRNAYFQHRMRLRDKDVPFLDE
ncbi:MAG TPA: VacJ family lipoprotein [Desulfobulbus sp.]|nr:VacJ family lipoprotein [Desulfobulbus sp.]